MGGGTFPSHLCRSLKGTLYKRWEQCCTLYSVQYRRWEVVPVIIGRVSIPTLPFIEGVQEVGGGNNRQSFHPNSAVHRRGTLYKRWEQCCTVQEVGGGNNRQSFHPNSAVHRRCTLYKRWEQCCGSRSGSLFRSFLDPDPHM